MEKIYELMLEAARKDILAEVNKVNKLRAVKAEEAKKNKKKA